MQFYTQNLTAGKTQKMALPGRVFLIDSISAAGVVDVTLYDQGGSPRQIMPDRRIGFKCITEFSAVEFTAAVDTIIKFFVSMDEVDLGIADGAAVSVPSGVEVTNTAANRVPVDVGGATINVTATNVTIDNTDADPVPVKLHASDDTTPIPTSLDAANVTGNIPVIEYQAQAVANVAPVAVDDTVGGVAIVAADATRRGLRLRNVGENIVALIATGGTYANAAVIIQPGETWNENEAPGAAWYGICDTALTSTINIQTIS